MNTRKKITNWVLFISLVILAAAFLVPIILVVINSFKSQFYITGEPFKFPNEIIFLLASILH